MGVAKPIETERGALGRVPGPPVKRDVRGLVSELVRPGVGAAEVVVAGRRLDVEHRAHRDALVDALREALVARFLERRPNADAATYMHFEIVSRGVVADRTTADQDLLRTLVEAVDGL